MLHNQKVYKVVEFLCKQEGIMEKHYGVVKFDDYERYFTTSQEADVMDLIS